VSLQVLVRNSFPPTASWASYLDSHIRRLGQLLLHSPQEAFTTGLAETPSL
jgi:hypothetical protein